MTDRNDVELAVRRWSAWAPGVSTRAEWRDWARGERVVGGEDKPDVRDVPVMMRRRLSSLARMAFRVAIDCLADGPPPQSYLFCSRYGEFARSYDLLQGLTAGEPASAAAFSMSVHNTAASLFTIDRHDRAPTTALAAGEATVETAFLEAWCDLRQGKFSSLLLVYHDEPLPELYRSQVTSVPHPIAFAFLLGLPDLDPEAPRLHLTWRPGGATPAPAHSEGGLGVLRLLLAGGGPLEIDCGRLVWSWSRGATTA